MIASTTRSWCTITATTPSAAAEGERADVAHEDLRGVGVVPEEAEAGADDRGAEDQQLARPGHVRDLQVGGEVDAPRHVGEDREVPARPSRGPIASPSRPSVRLTALLLPTMTKYVRTTKATAPIGSTTFLKNGT